jgi:hypothetical protein
MAGVSTDSLEHAGRFALAQFDDGAVLLDLATGTFYRLNEVAAEIFQKLAEGRAAADVAADIARSFAIPAETARRDVESLLEQLVGKVGKPASSNPITFRSDAAGYVLHWNGQPFWHVDRRGRELTYLADADVPAPDPTTQLLWVVPHVFLLQQRMVLHASAIEQAGEVVALCGSSGRGKTTLARLLAKEGMNLVSEDLLLVQLDHETPDVAIHGEKTLRAWVAARAAALVPKCRIPTDGLAQAVQGPRLPLGRILFPCRTHQPMPIIQEQPLGRAAGLLLLLENSFAEVGIAEVWRWLWDETCKIATATPVAKALVPEGLAPLQEAVRDYSRKVKSYAAASPDSGASQA